MLLNIYSDRAWCEVKCKYKAPDHLSSHIAFVSVNIYIKLNRKLSRLDLIWLRNQGRPRCECFARCVYFKVVAWRLTSPGFLSIYVTSWLADREFHISWSQALNINNRTVPLTFSRSPRYNRIFYLRSGRQNVLFEWRRSELSLNCVERCGTIVVEAALGRELASRV